MTAEILLLGDSFSNVYSLNEMGWGEAGGFAEQLSYELKRPVDAIIRNDSGAYATREILSQELASGNDRLAGKKVVIWEFAVRELAVGDWRVKSTPMKLGQSIESHFLQVKVGSSHAVSGVVQEISSAPVPGTVPYRDHIIYIHLRDIESHDGVDLYSNQALVAMYSMRDQLWTKAARFRVGQKIQLRLLNYGEINQLYNVERINSSMLDSENAFETPCWGEELDASAQSASEPGNAIRMDSDFGVPELSGFVAVLTITMVIYAYLNRREDKSRKNKE
jgi:alginate O-acetyltransferase complex protein AlgJ